MKILEVIRKENNSYLVCIAILFMSFIVTGTKYTNLKVAYQKAEKDKVYYCKEYHKLKCQLENE